MIHSAKKRLMEFQFNYSLNRIANSSARIYSLVALLSDRVTRLIVVCINEFISKIIIILLAILKATIKLSATGSSQIPF